MRGCFARSAVHTGRAAWLLRRHRRRQQAEATTVLDLVKADLLSTLPDRVHACIRGASRATLDQLRAELYRSPWGPTMMLTLIVAQLVVYSAAPPLSAADAAAVLARLDSASNWTNRVACRDCDGPRVTIVPYRPGDGPFGAFPIFELAPLDCCTFYQAPIYQRAWNGTDRHPSRAIARLSPNVDSSSREIRRPHQRR